ncbi:MAG: arsenate reductase ArsC [Anaeroplasmataceae bacterium]
MKKVAFLCVHNSCRSQIAEALCKVYRKDLEAYSAGTELKPQINKDAVRIMKEKYNIDMSHQKSKLVSDIPNCDIYISMGCDVGCPFIGRGFDDDFQIIDPTGKNDDEFIKVIEEIKEKILKIEGEQ